MPALSNLVGECEEIDGDFPAPGVVLLDAGEESLSEVETGEPELLRSVRFVPCLQKYFNPWGEIRVKRRAPPISA